MEFRYDPFGNRIAKIEKSRDENGVPQPAKLFPQQIRKNLTYRTTAHEQQKTGI